MKLSHKLCASLIATSVILPGVAFAQEDTSTNSDRPAQTIGELRDRNKDKIEEDRDEVEAKREEAKNKLEERRQEIGDRMEEKRMEVSDRLADRLVEFVEKLQKRFLAAVERLEKLSSRIASRIAKFEERGADVEEAKRLLEEANKKIATAKASSEAIVLGDISDAGDNASSTSSVLREAYGEVKEAVTQAKADVKEAHGALVDVIRVLKSVVVDDIDDSSDDDSVDDNS